MEVQQSRPRHDIRVWRMKQAKQRRRSGFFFGTGLPKGCSVTPCINLQVESDF